MTSTLPELETYSADELARVRATSPAFARVERWLADESMDELRFHRHRAWARCVAATLLNRATTEAICTAWSEAADEVLGRAWIMSGLDRMSAVLLALGKLGARELNLSSDVDLVVVGRAEQAPAVMRSLRKFRKLLGESDRGFCFRLDFDLRPGGGAGPLVCTPAQFQEHYWRHGEPWERLALVRLRTLIGDENVRREIEDLAIRYVYRPHLDFAMTEDLRRLRTSIHAAGFVRRSGEINLKLEAGGIRDVELFTHLQIVIHGGRLPALRTVRTGEALDRLRDHGVIEPATAHALIDAYWTWRDLENRAQLVEDRQTHEIPDTDPSVIARLARIDDIVTRALRPAERADTWPASLEAQNQWLRELGFSEPVIAEVWPTLLGAEVRSSRHDRDESARREFLTRAVHAIARLANVDRDLGLATLADFTRAVRGKAALFQLLVDRSELVDQLARFFCVSPYLGAILARRPEVFDALVRPVRPTWSEDPARLLEQLREVKFLSEVRAAGEIMSAEPVAQVFSRLTDVADQLAGELLRGLRREYPGTAVDILALGKWGGRELGLRSDLDFVFVTDREPTADDLRVARRFVTRVTDPSGFGSLYDIDLRLRPSGQSGPLMVTRAKVREHLATVAPAWQRQAYLRARPLTGEVDLRGWSERPLTADERQELARIRGRLLKSDLDVKFAAGALLDIEFTAQVALLARGIEDAPSSTVGMITRLGRESAEWSSLAPDLVAHYDELRRVEQGLQLTSSHRTTTLGDDAATKRAAALLGRTDLVGETRASLRAFAQRLDGVDETGFRRT